MATTHRTYVEARLANLASELSRRYSGTVASTLGKFIWHFYSHR